MGVTNSELEAIKHEIEKTSKAIQVCFSKLGQVASSNHAFIHYPASDDAFMLLENASHKVDVLDDRINNLKTSINIRYEDIEKHNRLSEKLRTLIASLGAIAYEVNNNGNLPQTLVPCLKPMFDFDEKTCLLEQKATSTPKILSFIADRNLKNHKAMIKEAFYNSGILLKSNPDVVNIPGSRAQNVLQELSDVTKALETCNPPALTIRYDETKQLRELENERAKLLESLDVHYTEYGKVLAEGMDVWLNVNIPEEVQKCCASIKNEFLRYEKQTLRQDYLLAEREIDIILAENNQFIDQLEHLNQQRDLVEKQIADVKFKLKESDSAISALRTKEEKIRRKSESIQSKDIL